MTTSSSPRPDFRAIWGSLGTGVTGVPLGAGWRRDTLSPPATAGQGARAGGLLGGQTRTVLSLAAPRRLRRDLAAQPGYKSWVSDVARVSLKPPHGWGTSGHRPPTPCQHKHPWGARGAGMGWK